MADDQGWGDVSYNGHAHLKTPTLDDMAATGLRLDRFYAAAPVCSPTRGSVMTGRHPNRFGCFSWGYTLRPEEVTLAEALQKAGYRTGHFGKWHLGAVRSDSPVSPGQSGFEKWVSSPNFYENDPLMSHAGKVVQLSGEGSEATVEVALDFIAQAARDKQPFLAVIWFGSPHSPHVAIDRDRQLYREHPPHLQDYYGEIAAMDRALGHLRRQLRELGVSDNTLLWYTSDNGAQGPGSTGGLAGKKGTLWEGGIRVPTVLQWPAQIDTPRSSTVPCGTVDIYPTLLELAGATGEPQPQPLDGISLVPLIQGKSAARDQPLGFWVYPAKGIPVKSAQLLKALATEQATGKPAAEVDSQPSVPLSQRVALDERPGHAAWIDGRFKLHRIPGQRDAYSYQLFDLETDPQETKDLAEQQPERTEQMRSALESWQQSVLRSLNGEDYGKG